MHYPNYILSIRRLGLRAHLIHHSPHSPIHTHTHIPSPPSQIPQFTPTPIPTHLCSHTPTPIHNAHPNYILSIRNLGLRAHLITLVAEVVLDELGRPFVHPIVLVRLQSLNRVQTAAFLVK